MLTQRLDEAVSNLQAMVQQITNDIQRFDATPLAERAPLDADIKGKLTDLDNRLNKMSRDIKAVPTNSREYFESEYNDLRSQYNQLVWDFQEKKGANAPGMSREQFLARRQQAAAVSSDLDEALHLGTDVVSTQNATMNTLGEDRRLLENVNINLDLIDGEAHEGHRRANRMISRMLLSACLAWTIVVVLLLIDIALGYLFFARQFHLPPFKKKSE